jgi:hypothetical protein
MNWLAQAVVGWLIAALIELVLHWFPWRMALKVIMPWASLAGVLGMGAPFAGILLLWIKQYQPLMPLLPDEIYFRVLVCFSGMVVSTILAISLGYFVDWLLDKLRQADELSEIQRLNDKTGKIGTSSRE